MCPRKARARAPPGRDWLSQGPRLTNSAVSSSGRIAQDAEVVGQRPEAPRYEVEDDMTARRFAERFSLGSDGCKERALMSPVGAPAAVTGATGLPIGLGRCAGRAASCACPQWGVAAGLDGAGVRAAVLHNLTKVSLSGTREGQPGA